MGLSRRRAVLGLASATLAAPAGAAPPLALSGRFQQGGFALGRTSGRAQVILDGQAVTRASDAGYFYVGFDRDAGPSTTVHVLARDGEASRTLQISPRAYDIQHIRGLGSVYQGQASPELEARMEAENRRKAEAFGSHALRDDFRDGFAAPLRQYRVTGRFGGQRIVGGVRRPPHYGVDLAAPRGTPLFAPAGGVVVLAENGMLFEGGLILIDHGQGVVTAYLHLSAVDVLRGQTVSRGERIGAVGATGRATGPHLCWRLKWRGRHMDPLLMVGATGPA